MDTDKDKDDNHPDLYVNNDDDVRSELVESENENVSLIEPTSSLIDPHALATYGELDSLQIALMNIAQRQGISLSHLINESDTSGLTLLHTAASEGHLAVVTWLLEQGANRLLADINGMTPLHYAAGIGDVAVIRALLSATTTAPGNTNLSSYINHVDHQGRTAIHWASSHQHDNVIAVLIAAGGDPTIKDKQGRVGSDAMKKIVSNRRVYYIDNMQLIVSHCICS